MSNIEKHINKELFSEISNLTEESKKAVAVTVNASLTMLYWKVGKRINDEILQNQRAGYGEQIIVNLSNDLISAYGKGWGIKHIRHCLRTAETFSDEQIVYTLCRQLTWSHLRVIAYIDNELKRQFYIEMCRLEKWSIRTLNEKIGSMLYERTAISKKPEETNSNDIRELRENGKLSLEMVFRDPYFLGLKIA